MQQTFKRYLSAVLVLAMVLTMMPHLGHTHVTAVGNDDCEHVWENSVCTRCEAECAHETWDEATCEAPATCAACGKTEGIAHKHTLVDNTATANNDKDKLCTECNKVFLAYLDFEDVTFVQDSTTNLTDGSVVSAAVDGVSYVRVEDGLLHIAATANATAAVNWNYKISTAAQTSITLSYNVAATGNAASIFNFPVISGVDYPSPVQFGAYISNVIRWKSTAWQDVTIGTGADATTMPLGSTPRWYTVKMVYSVDSNAENGYRISVEVDGQETNCVSLNSILRTFNFITAQINNGRSGHIYIDNVRATAGNVDHVAAVPTVCLCASPKWGDDGICDVCQAHCAHNWDEADCDTARTCNLCQMTTGEALGHKYENGVCSVCNTDCGHEKFTDEFCDNCGYKCPHAQWNAPNCKFGEVCARCGKEQGEKGVDHVLGDDQVCDHCGTTVLADLDFEGTNPEIGVFTGTDGTAAVGRQETYEEGSVLYFAVTGTTSANATWYYDMGTTVDNIKLSYNFAFETVGAAPIMRLPAFSQGQTVSPVQLGTHASNSFKWSYGGTLRDIVIGEGNSTATMSFNSTPRWHTVEIFYSKDSANSYTIEVYLDGQPTDCDVTGTGVVSSIRYIAAYIFKGKTGKIYIDNVYATTGAANHIHEAAVPTVCLCATPSWNKDTGICDGCGAHCIDHVWVEATCDKAKYCDHCGMIEGEPLGHSWEDGVCTRCPATCTHNWVDSKCTICHMGCAHHWIDANCTSPKKCDICGKTEGEVSHSWVDADCENPKHCLLCPATEGEALGHDYDDETGKCKREGCNVTCTHNWVDSKCTICHMECAHHWIDANCQAPKTCQLCGKEEGSKGDHVIVNNACTVPGCDFAFLAYLDFSDSNDLAGFSDSTYLQIIDNKVLEINNNTSNNALRIGIALNTSASKVTVSYNILVKNVSVPDFYFPAPGSDSIFTRFPFGMYNGKMVYSGDRLQLTDIESGESIPYNLGRWYTVEIVYDFSGADKVSINGVETNATTSVARAITCIAMQIPSYTCFYIDNLRVTSGDVDHDAAVPTVCLCETSKWVNGVCSICQAHCVDHTWVDADCDTPRTCSHCGMTEGKAQGHKIDEDTKKCTVCGIDCPHEDMDKNHVCTICGYECEHKVWNDANCTYPKTCALCGLTDGHKGQDHVLGNDLTCDYCNTTFLAYYDYEGETVGRRPSGIGASFEETSTTQSLKVVEVDGNKVLSVGTQAGATSNIYVQWWYQLPSSYDAVTLSYNLMQISNHASNFLTVGKNNTMSNPTVRFGTGSTNLVYYDGTSTAAKALAAADANESISNNLNQWHTVKIVYDKTNTETPVKVFLDGVLTNVTTANMAAISHIGMYVMGKNGDAFYVDNIRVTEGVGADGNGSHEPMSLAGSILPDLDITYASLSLYNNLQMDFWVLKEKLDAYGSASMSISLQDKPLEVTDRRLSSDGKYYIYSYSDIAPNHIGEVITATLSATYCGTPFTGEEVNVSAKQYCYYQLNEGGATGKLQTLLVDLLNYCTEAQTFVGETADANAGLTEDQRLAATAVREQMVNALGQTTPAGVSTSWTPSVTWKSAELVLKGRVTIRLKFQADDITNLSVVLNNETTDETFDPVTTFKPVPNEAGCYYVDYDKLTAYRMSDVISFAVMQNGEQVSKSLTYSVESYVYAVRQIASLEGTALDRLTTAMLCYGDSARNYVFKAPATNITPIDEVEIQTFTMPAKKQYDDDFTFGIAGTDKTIAQQQAEIEAAIEYAKNMLVSDMDIKDYTFDENGDYWYGYDVEGYRHIKAITFDGLKTATGETTKIFGYFGLPEGASAENPVPGIVLVHGGGGKPMMEWVKLWNDRGYAAIACSNMGEFPVEAGRVYVKDGHADSIDSFAYGLSADFQEEGHTASTDTRWGTGYYEVSSCWQYHAITQTILANNILRQNEAVDADKVGICGISWGGVLTTHTIGRDNRFAFAIPTYGHAYLGDRDPKSFGGYYTDEVDALWASERYLDTYTNPIYWLAWNDDAVFTIPQYTKSYMHTQGQNSKNTLAMVGNWGHGMGVFFSRTDDLLFANWAINSDDANYDSPGFVTFKTQPEGMDVNCRIKIPENVTGVKAHLYFVTEPLTYNQPNGQMDQTWQVSKTVLTVDEENGVVSGRVPDSARGYYVQLVYTIGEQECNSSSIYVALD